MTTLIAWVACDGAKKSAVYLASDSRLSWGTINYWDFGRKIFASEKHGDILGYCGDALFCSQQLSQIVTYIDSCSSFGSLRNSNQRADSIYDLIRHSFGKYPKDFALPNFSIIYLTRSQKHHFHAYKITWSKPDVWEMTTLLIPSTSSIITVDGSGRSGYEIKQQLIKKTDFGTYSRSYFYALCEFIKSKKDFATGGAPQISGIYNKGPAKNIGVIYKGQRYIYGLEVPNGDALNNIRWVNETFENCDGIEMNRAHTAQPQPAPLTRSGK